MDELKKEYTILFNGITDTIRDLQKTIAKLQVLQQKAEEAIVERDAAAPPEAEPPETRVEGH